jgi:hypothetical protein
VTFEKDIFVLPEGEDLVKEEVYLPNISKEI